MVLSLTTFCKKKKSLEIIFQKYRGALKFKNLKPKSKLAFFFFRTNGTILNEEFFKKTQVLTFIVGWPFH
ncbi:hypothetical protein MPTA6494_6230 [Mycoplasmoides pneumoniae]|nr:hypothetical protein KPI25BX_4800 [Mycoplasmoides pneumoniae]